MSEVTFEAEAAIILDIPNRRDDAVLRVATRERRGRRYAEIRLYLRGRYDGQLRPSGKGVNIEPHRLRQIAEALLKAEQILSEAPR